MNWIDELKQKLPALQLEPAEPLSAHTSFRIGGPAAMAFPRSEAELSALLQRTDALGIPRVILGAGTNVLAPDEGLDSLVICTKGLCGLRDLGGGHLEADCGVTLARAAMFAKNLGLTGLEFAHGIPGTVGGGAVMNAGAYGGELKQVAVCTTVLEPDGALRRYEGEAQGFGYRRSAFEKIDGLVLRVEFTLRPGDPAEIQARMEELARKRRASQPLELPSAGSTFKRPEGAYAAALIEGAGLKGLTEGGAQVSEKHAGFVVNRGGATAADVRRLIDRVQAAVYADSGFRLEPEVKFL